ncbi:ankyrin repeat-containing domain protein [Pyronema domesticum]|nr:ankyrin repeat-containing domain protein [Pyronema domesticum]
MRERGRPALIYASKHGYADFVRLILQRTEIEINLQDRGGKSALLVATKKGHIDVVRLLLEREDINTSLKDGKGYTALLCASHNGHQEIGNDGDPALMCAALAVHTDIVRLLLGRAEINTSLKNKKDDTALSIAIEERHTEIINLLKEHEQALQAKENETTASAGTEVSETAPATSVPPSDKTIHPTR